MALLSGGISPFTKVIGICNIFSTWVFILMSMQFSRIFFLHKDVCLDQYDHEVVCLSDLFLGKRQYVSLCFIVLSYTWIQFTSTSTATSKTSTKNNNNKNNINIIIVIGLVAGMDAITRGLQRITGP